MPILDQLPADNVRSEPLVWVRRLVLYESLDPLQVIRDIPLRSGLNIVWGVEEENDDHEFTPGHGVGKTTLCRLIRYCLGESSFGQEHAAAEIRHTFPEGYVAAEIRLNQQNWSVLRPFGQRRASCAEAGVSIEELIADRPARKSYQEFRSLLESSCLEGIRAEHVLTSGSSILWDHLLAMCSRDQEARYQSIWQWRSPRSASGTPWFKLRKVDALLCLRAVLELLPEAETALQQRLQRIADDLSKVENDIAERRREPDYWVRHLRRTLRREHDVAEAEEAPLDAEDMYGLPSVVGRRANDLDSRHGEVTEELEALDRQIALASAALQEPAELKQQVATAADATDEGTSTLLDSIQQLEALRRLIADAEFSLCRYGGLPIGQCGHAQQRLGELDDEIRQARSETLPEASRREQVGAALQEQRKRLSETVKRLQDQLDTLIARRRELEDERRNASTGARRLRETLAEIREWDAIRSGTVEDSDLSGLLQRKVDLEGEQARVHAELDQLLSAQDRRADSVRRAYDSLVKSTLSNDFTGRVGLSKEGLEFRIIRGESLSGEAFETLSILLADLTALLMGALGQARHPGVLIHDSPREADLGVAIYRRFLLATSALAAEVCNGDEVPFQYIVTTTTPPPTELSEGDTVAISLGGEHGLLFNRQLASPAQDAAAQLELEFDDDTVVG